MGLIYRFIYSYHGYVSVTLTLNLININLSNTNKSELGQRAMFSNCLPMLNTSVQSDNILVSVTVLSVTLTVTGGYFNIFMTSLGLDL